MKNILKLIVLSLFIFSCTDKSVNNIGDMTLEEYAKSDNFISFTDEDLKKSLEIPVDDSTAENREIMFKAKAITYRFFKKCSYNKGIVNINIKRGKEIQISENIFSELKKNIDNLNKCVREQSSKYPEEAKRYETGKPLFKSEDLENLIKEIN